MADNEMFASAVRSDGDHGGVFEYDGDTGYFYLYEINGNEGHKVISAIRLVTSTPDFIERDLAIHWDSTESKVGLFIHEQLWAAFDLRTGAKYGGNYRANQLSVVPFEIAEAFKSK